MKPAPFRYHAPITLPEALSLLGELGDDAKILAGGQSLLPMLGYRLMAPAHLVDIGRISELRGWELDDMGLRIRAMARQRDIELDPDIGLRFPILHSALANVAHAQIRNRGTVCGSLAHADPAAELPATMVALDATMVLERAGGGRRAVPAAEFFQFHFTTAVETGELLAEVHLPDPGPGRLGAFLEVSHRKGDFALVGVATVVGTEGDRVKSARIVCSGVAPTPFVASAAEEALTGRPLDDATMLAAQYATGEGMSPTDDFHAEGDYRRRIAGVLVRRSLDVIRSQQGVLSA